MLTKEINKIKDKRGFKLQSKDDITYLIKKTGRSYIIISVEQEKKEVILICYKRIQREDNDFICMDEENDIINIFDGLMLEEKRFKLSTPDMYISDLKKIMQQLTHQRSRKELLESYNYTSVESANKCLSPGNREKIKHILMSRFKGSEVKENLDQWGSSTIYIPVSYRYDFTTIAILLGRYNNIGIKVYAYPGAAEEINMRLKNTLEVIEEIIDSYADKENSL